jgi:hypothetical protein
MNKLFEFNVNSTLEDDNITTLGCNGEESEDVSSLDDESSDDSSKYSKNNKKRHRIYDKIKTFETLEIALKAIIEHL